MNRLIREKSPYLIQHAHNPVDWHPWGPEAFEKARREEKPLFLSIGYSTCHWCHVMAHESFEDPHVAGLLNEAFVPVKVDREERPDIDQLYMRVCHMMTGSGGWPLTILMTADGKPFYAGTYLPKESRFGRMGMLELIPRIKQMWDYERGRLYALAERVTQALQEPEPQEPGPRLGPAVLRAACRQLEFAFDEQFGGFGGAPKFPTPHTLAFLLRYWKRTGEARPLAMVEKTLAAMRRGGIFDQLGFGFHRYSTDAEWKVPHFEKMLYDQALLVLVYLEAFQATGRPEHRRTAEEVIEFVLRDLAHPEGGFLSAVDADSEGEEGRFYLWSEEEVRRLLDPREAGLVIRVFNLRRGGNFHDPSTPRPAGGNILHPALSPGEAAAGLGLPPPEAEALLESARRKLLAAREQRVHPGRDDKVLTDWNGLMIAALARAAAVLDQPRYGQAAERAMEFLLARLRDPEGRLLHRWRDGEAAVAGQAADYACLTWGALELYGLGFRTRHLELALRLTERLLEDFWDAGRGGFYITASPAGGREPDLPVRPKELNDGALPSANSVALLNLLRLARLTGKTELEEKASRLARAFSRTVLEHPSGYTQFLCAVDFALGPACELVICGPPDREDTRRLVRRARERFLPGLVVLLKPAEPEEEKELAVLAPYTARLPAAAAGPAVAFVCRDFACGRPTPDAEQMIAFLEGGAREGADPDGG